MTKPADKFGSMMLAVDKPARMFIKHPVTMKVIENSKGEKAYIDLYSADSEIAERHRLAWQQDRLERTIESRGKVKPDLAEEQKSETELLVALTADWHLIDPSGNDIELMFSPDAAREFYSARGVRYVREQAEAFIYERANFLPASPNS